jgi:hypothetical protein
VNGLVQTCLIPKVPAFYKPKRIEEGLDERIQDDEARQFCEYGLILPDFITPPAFPILPEFFIVPEFSVILEPLLAANCLITPEFLIAPNCLIPPNNLIAPELLLIPDSTCVCSRPLTWRNLTRPTGQVLCCTR